MLLTNAEHLLLPSSLLGLTAASIQAIPASAAAHRCRIPGSASSCLVMTSPPGGFLPAAGSA
eukprot:7724272-Heterocapsa_arctica.AAC.1